MVEVEVIAITTGQQFECSISIEFPQFRTLFAVKTQILKRISPYKSSIVDCACRKLHLSAPDVNMCTVDLRHKDHIPIILIHHEPWYNEFTRAHRSLRNCHPSASWNALQTGIAIALGCVHFVFDKQTGLDGTKRWSDCILQTTLSIPADAKDWVMIATVEAVSCVYPDTRQSPLDLDTFGMYYM